MNLKLFLLKDNFKILIIPQFARWFSWAKGDDRNESIHHPVPPNFLFVVAIFFLGATDSTLLLPSARLGRRKFIEQVGYVHARAVDLYVILHSCDLGIDSSQASLSCRHSAEEFSLKSTC